MPDAATNEIEPIVKAPTEAERMAALEPLVSGPYEVLEDGRIDCNVNHPIYGVIRFTSDPNDYVEHGRMIHAIALKKGAS